jgi:hypothetical protein
MYSFFVKANVSDIISLKNGPYDSTKLRYREIY